MATRSKVYLARPSLRRTLRRPGFVLIPSSKAAVLRQVYGHLRTHGYTAREARRLVVTLIGLGITSHISATVRLVTP